MLGATPNGRSEQLRCRKLFIMSRDDANADGPRLPKFEAEYAKAMQGPRDEEKRAARAAA